MGHLSTCIYGHEQIFVGVGIFLIAAGFYYDVRYAGILYQDASAELIVEYERNQDIANWIMISGSAVIAAGLLIKVFRWLHGTLRRSNSG